MDADGSDQYGMDAVGIDECAAAAGARGEPRGHAPVPAGLGLGKEAGQAWGVAESCARARPLRRFCDYAATARSIPKGACHGASAGHIRSPLMAGATPDRGARC